MYNIDLFTLMYVRNKTSLTQRNTQIHFSRSLVFNTNGKRPRTNVNHLRSLHKKSKRKYRPTYKKSGARKRPSLISIQCRIRYKIGLRYRCNILLRFYFTLLVIFVAPVLDTLFIKNKSLLSSSLEVIYMNFVHVYVTKVKENRQSV